MKDLPSLSVPPMRRRDFLKRSSALAGVFALSGASRGDASAQAANELKLIGWSGWADPIIVAPFEEKYGAKVRIKEYTSGENMLALLSSSPPGTFDVINADAEYVGMLQAGGYLEKHDPADYPLQDYWPEFQKWPLHWIDGDLYAVMVRFGYLGLAYNTEAYRPSDLGSYKALWSETVAGKVGLFDWYLPSMGVLSLYNGNKGPFDIDQAAFDELAKTMLSLQPKQIAGFYSYADTYSALSKGQVLLVPGVGEWLTLGLRKDGVPVNTFIPDEGGIQFTESLSIAKGSKNQELARKFIQYITSPEGQVQLALKPDNQNSIPNIAGWKLLNEKHPDEANWMRHRFDQRNVMDEYKEGKIVPRRLPIQQSIEEWTEVWARFKSL